MDEPETLSIYEFMELVPTEDAAVAFVEKARWGNRPVCPHCGSFSVSRCTKPMTYRCRNCRKHFSVRTGSAKACSQLPIRKWLFAAYFIYV